METQRSIPLFFVLVILCTSVFVSPVSAGISPTRSQILTVGLLSSRDARPMAVVGPCRSADDLTVILLFWDGTSTRHVLSGDLYVALEQQGRTGRGNGGPAPCIADGDETMPYTVQTGSFGSRDAAERFAEEVRGHWPDAEVWIEDARLEDGRTACRVFAGRFPDRQRALDFTTSLAAYGMDGAFVAGTGGMDSGGVAVGLPMILYHRTVGLVRGLQRVTLSADASNPQADGDALPVFRLDGSPYRGSLEIRGGPEGLVAINRVELEDYLLGVVPCELGPDRFPLVEALKAQAVAARTYALKHAGRHRGEGFDLCDTPHCQVYGGAGRELPLSSEAVRGTSGLAAFHDGELAETLYTSTCGGRTERSSDVFSGPAAPYLSGVACTAQPRGVPLSLPAHLIRPASEIAEAESGADIGFALALLTSLEILTTGEVTGTDAHEKMSLDEAQAWVRRIVSRLQPSWPPPMDDAGKSSAGEPTRGRLAASICQALGWDQRLETLFSDADLRELVGDDGGCSDLQQRALAALLSVEVFHPLPDGRSGAEATESRGRFAAALARLAAFLLPGVLDEGVMAGAGQGRLTLRFGAETDLFEVAPEGVALFERRGESTRPIRFERFSAGDRVMAHLNRQRQVDLLVRVPAAGGAAADRYSPYSFWSIVVDREAIEEVLEEKGHHIGRLIDLQPLERGSTGRMIRLRVVGSEGTTVLRGLDIRWILGTRETLFFIDRVKSADGSNRSYRFTGRGWGHGVGMCQVGAAGLAETGATFVEILEHYYPGISIAPAAGAVLRPQEEPGGPADF